MNIYSLPSKIRTAVESAVGEEDPSCIIRASSSAGGSSGETYIISFKDRLQLFSKEMGSYDYDMLDLSYGADINELTLREEKYNLFLDLVTGSRNLSLKFGTYERENIQVICRLWASAPDDVETAALPTATREPANEEPVVYLAAALMFAAASDGEMADSERQYIHEIVSQSPNALEAGLTYYEAKTIDALLLDMAKLNDQQKLCILANVVELCMKDGSFRSKEQDLIAKMADAIDVARDTVENIRNVLLIKNDTSVFSS